MDYELFEHASGWGYRIITNGNVSHYQEFDPEKPGETPMTYEKAQQYVQIVLARLSQ